MNNVRRWGALMLMVGLLCLPNGAIAVNTPSAADIRVAQGEYQTIEIPVENNSGTAQHVELSLSHVRFDAHGEPVLERSVDDESWMNVSQKAIYIEAGETQYASVTSSPNEHVASGSYVFALLATETREGPMALVHGTATLIFVTVGSVQGDARCVNFSHGDDGAFSLTLHNAGQGILYEEGDVVLRGPFNIAFASVPSNPSSHRIFAGQTRTWAVDSVLIPWWAFGPLSFSLESDHLSSTCSRIPAGFGWIPFVGLSIGISGIFAIRRRK
jgi:hypothetical protein